MQKNGLWRRSRCMWVYHPLKLIIRRSLTFKAKIAMFFGIFLAKSLTNAWWSLRKPWDFHSCYQVLTWLTYTKMTINVKSSGLIVEGFSLRHHRIRQFIIHTLTQIGTLDHRGPSSLYSNEIGCCRVMRSRSSGVKSNLGEWQIGSISSSKTTHHTYYTQPIQAVT